VTIDTREVVEPPTVQVDVVVVGAGPIGLAACLLLERAGLTGLVFERHESRPQHPKARGIRLRASELARLWGFDDALRALAMPGETHRFIYTTTLGGEEIARTAPASGATASWASTAQYRVAQDHLEEVMERQFSVETSNVALRKGETVVTLVQDGDGVTVTTEDASGNRSTSRGRYLVVADGVGSRTRGMLGLSLGDDGPAPYWHSVYWHGDLSDLTRDRPAIMYYTQTGGDALVGIAPAGGADRWVTIVQRPASAERPEPLTDDEARALIRAAVGRDDLDIDVVSSATFRISADVVDRYRVGRAFLAGDAAHSLPPTGGFGINTGFADIHNLVWKLAWVLRGDAPKSLLDSYEPERRTVALSNAAWSSGNAKRFIALKRALADDDRPEIERLVADQSRHVDPVDQDLGFSYSPLDQDAPPSFERVALGARAPHAPVRSPSGPVSTLALFDGRLSLVVGGDSRWLPLVEGQTSVSSLQVLVIGSAGFTGADGLLAERYDLGDRGAAIIRPDGHIAWLARGDEGATPERFASILDEVLGAGLSRS
jgi:putative polyketide hydroxylase